MPVAAVTVRGRLKVSSGSSTAISGTSAALLTPRFSVAPTVMTVTGVASDPVPAVVGTSASGSRAPVALPTPHRLSRSSPVAIR